jgi:hypothetical protein
MKEANNNEIDLLLRSLASRRDEPALQDRSGLGDGNGTASCHLDADELNSFAEGVIPAPARARYTAHLADCDACRGIVVSLTQSAGMSNRSEALEQKRRPGSWAKLTSLLSFPVLRYAIPALVLTAVIGISLLAMWQRRGESDFIAQNEPTVSAPSTDQLKEASSPPTQPANEPPSSTQKKADSRAADDSVKNENYLTDAKTGAVAGTGTGDVARAKDAGQPAQSASRSELRPGYAPEPKAAAAPPPPLTEADKPTQLAKEQPPAKLEQQERERDAYKNTTGDEHGPNRSVASRPTGALANRRLDGLSAGRGGPYNETKKGKAADVETRTVSGRRFTREGSAWVDTAYESAQVPIRVTRGSEQFRALVADEPGLRAIAEQLNGVVIVVWKNRAYRLQ